MDGTFIRVLPGRQRRGPRFLGRMPGSVELPLPLPLPLPPALGELAHLMVRPPPPRAR